MICDFLRSHHMIPAQTLELKLDIPITTIQKAVIGERNIPEKHIFPILCELVGYGMKIDGYTCEVDEFGHLYCYLRVETIDTIEVKSQSSGSSHFEYISKEYRIHYTDYDDLM